MASPAGPLNDWRLRLTPEEAGRLAGELRAVLARYRMDAPEIPAPADAQPVLLVTHLLPEPETAEVPQERDRS
ncbi:hypothetical protein [Streptomyces orinoci]|uniref:Uncharacterized protein n=1 Tax=Streptomyces orinoci TaxID=67339 RepID=A0ABV3JRC9_STRON|nr:hypothetical protein [Streptomyces orinoci]